MGLYRPTDREIAEMANSLTLEKIKRIDIVDAVEAVTESVNPLTEAYAEALKTLDYTAIGLVVMAMVREHYQIESMYEAHRWAEQVEDDGIQRAQADGRY